MTRFLKQIIFTTLFFSAFTSYGQEELVIVVGQIDSIKFDKPAFSLRQIQDSIVYANSTCTYENLESGAVISQGPSQYMHMSNPYILTIYVQKSFSTSDNHERLQVRVWAHENPEQFLDSKKPFAFFLTKKDSLGIYEALDFYRVFKTVTGKWVRTSRNT